MTTKKHFRVALIGAGHIAKQNHLPALRALADRAEVVAICGREATRTHHFAQEQNIPAAFTSLESMLADAQPDILVNCTANNLHYPFTMEALKKGCHVFCEKPPAIWAKEAQEMADLATHQGVFLGYNFQRRQSAAYRLLQKQIVEGTFGEIYHIKADYLRRSGIPGWGNFTNKTIQGGGALIDLGVHLLDLALGLIGYEPPKAVLANTYDHIGKRGGKGLRGSWDGSHFEVEDACFAHINFPSRASVTLSSSFALHRKEAETVQLQIFGTKAGATLYPLEIFTESAGEHMNLQFPHLTEPDHQLENTRAFLDACEGLPSNICNGQQGALLQSILEKIYASAQEN
ncbi:putative dehydrogenase [Dyadobacter jejuensis]|uniref:Putative dehydrogenase n=1 Tax=Dyadobacter jejuensis TaxID=1082580 RepID=A0A316AJ98_9BACT|nr:Gfo/Idh/MocA family oxidoreductase [Dyadobacter jejuensis]PWJ57652.1 putative dehydrogenase [Dyadobacter jejuensis]